jgi:TolA-binding protein
LDSVGAHVVLESGGADVRVTPHHGAQYRLSVGPFAVDVTGTRFDVGFTPNDEIFTLNLHEGTVIVSGCMLGEGRKLLAGESLSASCRTGSLEITGARSSASSERSVEAPAAPSVEAPAVPSVAVVGGQGVESGRSGQRDASVGASWQSLSRQGRFSEAYELVRRDGFGQVMSRASIGELSLLGDTARFAGKPLDALEAYQALRLRGAGSAAARQAAFSIARVHFDQRAAYAEAAQWFRTYLAEQPGGPLAREAQGRLMEALSRAGDRAGARSVAERYLAQYPGGPHERVARQLLAR